LALLRPDLALLLVPLTAPLFLTRLTIPPSGRELDLPPHELALLVSAAAALPTILIHTVRRLKNVSRWPYLSPTALGRTAVRYAPEALLLLAGVAGISMAVPEPQAHDDALRAFRWFIAEPLIFIALIRIQACWPPAGAPLDLLSQARRLLNLFVVGGTIVALFGLLQFASYLLYTQIEPTTFATGAGILGGIRRVTSVYGNPNNLGLYIGRVWPVAIALGLAAWANHAPRWLVRSYGLCVLLCLSALLLSLSRGAWLGASAALIVLTLPAARHRFGDRTWPVVLLAATVVISIGALIFALRGGLIDGSADVRILFWKESIKLLERHPLGVGLDQFFYYHYPEYGRSLIDPVLATTLERYARQPHNLLFEIWFNLGPLGALAFSWLLAGCLRRVRAEAGFSLSATTRLLARGVVAALAAALVHGLVDSFYFWPDIAIAFWLFVGVSELLSQNSNGAAH
jgi:hypothetical protein